MTMLKRLVAALCLPVIMMIAGCDSLPEKLEKRAASVERDLDGLTDTLKKRRADFVKIQKDTDAWVFFAPYAEREKWSDTFVSVESDLGGLRARYDRQVTPLLEADEEKGAPALEKQLAGIEANFKPLRDRMRMVSDRMRTLREGYENAPAWIVKARKDAEAVSVLAASVEADMEKAKSDFPERSVDIDRRSIPLTQLEDESQIALSRAEAEFAKHDAGEDADYAVFTDAVQTVGGNVEKSSATATAYRKDLDSLYKDYSTILRDVKIGHAVVIGRSSWDNCCDGDRFEKSASYPEIHISPSVADYLNKLPQGDADGQQEKIARYACLRSGRGCEMGVESYLNPGIWEGLNINALASMTDEQGNVFSWPDGHDEASFWIGEVYPVYYHKYAEVSGKTVTEGDWEEVDPAVYEAHSDDFGLSIETKKLGQFADEAVAEATPPGMEMVGDERYGNWNGQGNSAVWIWYPHYGYYGGYSRADYGSYNSWRNDRRAGRGAHSYYGSDRSKPTYGSHGSRTKASPSYAASTFNRSGASSRRVSESVRDKARSTRSRGAGRGGK